MLSRVAMFLVQYNSSVSTAEGGDLHNIPNTLALQIENTQKRAIKIIFEIIRGMPYSSARYCANRVFSNAATNKSVNFSINLRPDSCPHVYFLLRAIKT